MEIAKVDSLYAALGMFERDNRNRLVSSLNDRLGANFEVNRFNYLKSDRGDLARSLSLEDHFYYLGVSSRFESGIRANALILMDLASADELLCNMMGRHMKIVEHLAHSALMKLADSLLESLTLEISDMFGINITHSQPEIAIDLPHPLLKTLRLPKPNTPRIELAIESSKPIVQIMVILFSGSTGSKPSDR